MHHCHHVDGLNMINSCAFLSACSLTKRMIHANVARCCHNVFNQKVLNETTCDLKINLTLIVLAVNAVQPLLLFDMACAAW
jgi:hypothetical protein